MKLRILVSHNKYQQPGGEDSVADTEIELLRSHGHEVLLYTRDNADLKRINTLRAGLGTIWSRKTYREINGIIKTFKPDIIHSHNTFPLISPSIYWVASKNCIPVVQTLHNFRLFCLQAMFLREGKICEDCINRWPWRGIIRKCYRDSISQSLTLATLLLIHRSLGTYARKVTRYIALNQFCRNTFIRGGLPPEHISIKPNFVDLPYNQPSHTGSALYVGRLSEDKGINILAGALSTLPDIPVDIVGSGPLSGNIVSQKNLYLHGWLDMEATNKKMREASYLLMPSIWYENFPRTLVEAFACGLPVIASNLGAMAELVEDGQTGLLFKPGSTDDLREKIKWAENHPDQIRIMGHNARKRYEKHYTREKNYQQLINIYNEAISGK